MIGHAVLGEVVGADLTAAVAAAHLLLALLGNGGVLLLQLCLIQAGTENFHGALTVLMLAALVLTLHHRACGQVGNADGGLRLIDVLTACARGAIGVDLQLGGVDSELHLFCLGHDRHGGGRGLNATRGLRLRDALDAVGARLELQAGIGACALHGSHHFLHATQLRLVDGDDVYGKTTALGIHGVHTQQVCSEQRPLFPADACADLQDHVLVVVGVAGQQEDFDLFQQFLAACLGLLEFLLCQFPQFAVGEHLRSLSDGIIARHQSAVDLHHGSQLLLLTGQLR